MKAARLSILILAAGISSISGCGGSDAGGSGTGGSGSGGTSNTGGTTGTGGATPGTGGSGTGGSGHGRFRHGRLGHRRLRHGRRCWLAPHRHRRRDRYGRRHRHRRRDGDRRHRHRRRGRRPCHGRQRRRRQRRCGGSAGHGATGGAIGTGGTVAAGTCTASKSAGASASGTGPHKVTVETNSDSGINQGTIFRPSDLGGTEKYPIFVWGEGGCSENGLSNSVAMGEIASHGYFVIADGVPNGSASRSMSSGDPSAMGVPLLAYVTWAIAENDKPCSAYYQALDTTKIAANGFSCGGLMSEGTAADSRITTWGLNSSGLLSADATYLKKVHTPVLVVLGGSGDIAYTNGERDYSTIAGNGIPIMLFSKALGHGGDLFSSHGGDFTKIDIAWLNWQLKGDTTATGKGLLIGSSCPYCTDSAWEVKSQNIQ